MTHFDVVIVGAGHGGAQLAIALRQKGFEGSVGMIGAEVELPYERPPLSKEYLAGEKSFERMLVRPADFWEARKVRMRLGRKVVQVLPDDHEVLLEDGRRLRYRRLVWAAGGVPRSLACSGHDLAGVHSIRCRADVDRLIRELPRARQVAVIGGGYIGLEAAAILSKLGKQVVVLEVLDRVLARVAAEPISRFYEAEHRRHGIEIRTGIVVDRIEGAGKAACGVGLADGSVVAADIVIVAIGITAAVEPLLRAGAAGSDGVDVDEYCRTTLADVLAIGDCAAHRNVHAGGASVRLESVQNAHDQAVVVAQAIVGPPEPYIAVPWFWSNQFDLKLQTVGLSHGHDEIVVRGDPAKRSFSVVYLREGRVAALDCVNSVKDYVQGKRLVAERLSPPRERLADPSTPLKDL